jgi:hypothetical protein
VHTTRDQARAIVIPGQEDKRLVRFESRLYGELCMQHQRVGLFVSAKAGELERKLGSTERSIQKIVALNDEDGITPRRQRKLIKYERALLEIGDDISALQRFVNAQIEAFRKILKKYRKWTGSTELGARFREKILRSPNSFTRLHFDGLQNRYDAILCGLRDAIGLDSDSSAPISPVQPARQTDYLQQQHHFGEEPATYRRTNQPRYWNEYDDGSDCGNDDDEYVIYITPEDDDDDWTFPGLAYLTNILTLPYDKARTWFSGRHDIGEQKRYADDDIDTDNERRHLLSAGDGGLATDTDYGSDDNAPSSSSSIYGTLWFERQQHRQARHVQNRERILRWTSRGSFAAALVLLVVEVLMLGTGRPEVDIAVAVAALASLFFAGAGLWAGSWLRDDGIFQEHTPSPEAKLMSWAIFVVSLLLNVFVLGVVASNMGDLMRLWGPSVEGA